MTREFLEAKNNIIELIHNHKPFVPQLVDQDKDICPLIGKKIKTDKLLGTGTDGIVYSIKVGGKKSKYVMKKILDVSIQQRKIKQKDVTIEKLMEDAENSNIAPNAVFYLQPKIYQNNRNKKYRINEKIRWPEFAELCIRKEEYAYTDLMGKLRVIPQNSYICDDEQYSEYTLGLICAEIYTSHRSIHFMELYSFSTCYTFNKVYQYIFSEKLDNTLNDIMPCVSLKEYPEMVSYVFLQVVCAIAVYQKIFKISHNDLHSNNIFIQYIDQDTEYNGVKLQPIDYFQYNIGDVTLYIPFVPFIVKIADFGRSGKYSEPYILPDYLLATGYGGWIANWYTPVYDFFHFTMVYYLSNSDDVFMRNVMRWILNKKMNGKMISPDSVNELCQKSQGSDGSDSSNASIATSVASSGVILRPRLELLEKYKHATASNFIESDITKKFQTRPTNKKILVVTDV